MSTMPDWVTGFPGAVTVTGADHTVLYMNDAAAETFKARGGRELVGKNLLSVHNERSQGIIEELLATGGTNVYTIEKNGVKKLIYQSAWRNGQGEIAGLVEASLELPPEMPHYNRDQQ